MTPDRRYRFLQGSDYPQPRGDGLSWAMQSVVRISIALALISFVTMVCG